MNTGVFKTLYIAIAGCLRQTNPTWLRVQDVLVGRVVTDDVRRQGAAAGHDHGGHGCKHRVGDDLDHVAGLLFNLSDQVAGGVSEVHGSNPSVAGG